MENKKVFIGNLDFEVTESEVKSLLSKYGTVVSIKMYQKKGYAFAEMESTDEALKAAQKLDGIKYKDREIRASLEMKPGKAKSVSVKRYKERGVSNSRERSGNDSDTRSRSEKYRDTQKPKSGDRERNSGSSYNKSKERPSGFEDRSSGEQRKERPAMPRPERDRWATERPSETSRPSRDDRREGYGTYERSFEKSLERSGERSATAGNRPLKDYTKERPERPDGNKREWTPGKPSYQGRPSRDGDKPGYGRSPKPESGYRPREKSSGSSDRQPREYSNERTGTPRPAKREWTAEKPSYHDRPSRDGEKSGSPRQPGKEWSPEKPLRSGNKTSDSWKERPEKKEFSGDKPRDYSKPRSVSGSQNRFSKTARPKSGAGAGRSFSGTSRPKPRAGSGDRDRNKPSGRDE